MVNGIEGKKPVFPSNLNNNKSASTTEPVGVPINLLNALFPQNPTSTGQSVTGGFSVNG